MAELDFTAPTMLSVKEYFADKIVRGNFLRYSCNYGCPEAALVVLFAAAFRAAPTRHKLLAFWDVFLDDAAVLEMNKGEQVDGGDFLCKLRVVKSFVDLLNKSSRHISVPESSLDTLTPMMTKSMFDLLVSYKTASRKKTKIGFGRVSTSIVSTVSIPLLKPITGSYADAVLALKGAYFDTKGLGADALCQY